MKPNPKLGVVRRLTMWCGLLLALGSLPALAVTVTDTFTNAANWEAFLFAGPEYNLAVTNGRLNYTATVTNEGGAAVRRTAKDLPGNTNVLYLTQDWSLKVDVHIDPLVVTAYEQFTDVFLGFAKTGDEFNTHVIFEFDRGGWEYFNDYDIGDDVQINGNAAPGLFNVSGLTSPDAALRFDYNAASHTITYLFDANGATGGYNWASMGTTNLASGTYDLQLSASDTLTIILVGSSAITVVSNGQAYLDNLEITVSAAGYAPDSIGGYAVAGAITNINGTPFGPAAATNYYDVTTFSQLGPNADNTYSGNYTYVKTGPNTATIFTYKTAPPDQAGETGTNHLVFANPSTGTFAHYYDFVDTTLTVQYGTFQVVLTNGLTGALQVTLNPAGAVSAGAQWQVDGGAWQNSGVSVSNLSVGIHTVSYKNISGWSTPSSQTASIIANTTTITNGVYYSTADYTYTTNNGAITITGYTGSGGVITVPSTINGLPVTSIGNNAFSSKNTIRSVVLLPGITNLGSMAFMYCSGLTNVQLPDTLLTIGSSAFSPSGLFHITIPKSVTSVGGLAFSYCQNLATINVAQSNQVYSSLNGVLLDRNQVKLIAFPPGKSGSYVIPNTVTNIGTFAFDTCWLLTDISIPNTVHLIESYAFESCSSLAAINVNAANPIYQSISGVLFKKSPNWLIRHPQAKSGAYTIPTGVTSIADAAFSSCTAVSALTIPSSVSQIGHWAFHNCSSLTRLAIPDSVTSIGWYAFEYCYGLGQVTLPAHLGSIADYTFQYCSALTNIIIPSTITNIGSYAFLNCTKLSHIYCTGNAPVPNNSSIFTGTTSFPVYYLPGRTGWGATYGGRPAVLWNPTPLTSAANFGVQTNRFGFTLTGTANIPFVVEASTNLTGGSWTALLTGTLTNGAIYFSDPQWANHHHRYYRIRSP